jgi:hypothetical protein
MHLNDINKYIDHRQTDYGSRDGGSRFVYKQLSSAARIQVFPHA